VQLVEVDVVSLKAAERAFDGLHDPAARRTAMVDVIVDRPPKLGGKDDLFAASLERLADNLF
jgi:hypothetical protein